MKTRIHSVLIFSVFCIFFFTCRSEKSGFDQARLDQTGINKSVTTGQNNNAAIPEKWKWFNEARFGMFVHFGPYAAYGRGEQVLFRENLDQREYQKRAAKWNPVDFNAEEWARVAKNAGMRYAVLTSRHCDGYCLWDSKVTGYTSVNLAPKRDLVREFLNAMRNAGLRVGLYYSLADWRIPAFWTRTENDPEGWAKFKQYVYAQIRELLTNYGKLDVLWFDAAWPHSAEEWGGPELIKMARELQPDILINNRLGKLTNKNGKVIELGDFGTPEHKIVEEHGRLWESCQVSTWRLWGYTIGERWRPVDLLLDFLVECAGKGGNLLLNVGPQPDGRLPKEFIERMEKIGEWMKIHGSAIYGSERGEVCEFITYGRQTKKGSNLYLIIRFWDGRGSVHMGGLKTRVISAELMTTGEQVPFEQKGDHLYIRGLPKKPHTDLFPVIKLTCDGPPEAADWAIARAWSGNPERMKGWPVGDLFPPE